MKIIFLLDLQSHELDAIMDLVKTKSIFLDTHDQTEEKEYNRIKYEIDKFLNSSIETMVVRFTGRETIVKDLGDEYSEMIVALSTNKQSRYYTREIRKIFFEMLNKYLLGEK